MIGNIKIGRIFGIELRLHFSWLVIAVLVTLSLVSHFSAVNAGWGSELVWTTALATGLLFFVAVVLHELAHALAAKMRGLPVRSITLFAPGGITLIDKDAEDPTTEFLVAAAGPLMSLAIGGFCLLTAFSLGWSVETEALMPATPFLAAVVWLGYINIVLAIFNMIPGYPMDGGRILRALIWWTTGNGSRSTRLASHVGQFVATFFIVWGILHFLFGMGFGGLWLALIGWFLFVAAKTSFRKNAFAKILSPLCVGEIMRRDCGEVSSDIDLEAFVNRHLLRTRSRYYFVTKNNERVGTITREQVKKIRCEKWPITKVGQVMSTLEDFQIVAAQVPVVKAYEIMIDADMNYLPVACNDHVAGIITRDDILEDLYTHVSVQS